MYAGEFADQGAQARAIAGLMCTWHPGFEVSATSLALALLEHEVVDVHLDRGQFKHLMSVVRGQGYQLAMTTGTGAGLNEMDLGGAEQLGPVAAMALLPAAFACGFFALAFGFVER